MSKAKLDGEIRVQQYLTEVGFRVERFSKSERRRSKTPDFRVFAGDDLAFFCEVKTSQEDEWLDSRITGAAPGTLIGGARPDSIYNRIGGYIHTGVGQLDAINPEMDRPNVLAIVNGDRGAGFLDLIQVLTGNAYCESGEVWPIYREYSEGRIREAKLRVHLYLWCNDWKASPPQKFFPEVHSDHHVALCNHFGVNPAEVKRLPIVG